MSDPAVVEAFRSVRLFSNLAESHLQRLSEIARCVEFPARAEIFHEHDMATDVYVVIRGQISLDICEPNVGRRQLMEVGNGELIGWSSLLGRPRFSDSAHALAPTSAIAINGEKLLRLCQQDPEFGFEFMHRTAVALAERLSATRMQLLKLTGFQVYDAPIESD